MEFGADTWWIVATAATIAVGIISYFLKRTMNKQDRHEEDINHIKLTYVTRDQLKEFKDAFEKQKAKAYSPKPQLRPNKSKTKTESFGQFTI